MLRYLLLAFVALMVSFVITEAAVVVPPEKLENVEPPNGAVKEGVDDLKPDEAYWSGYHGGWGGRSYYGGWGTPTYYYGGHYHRSWVPSWSGYGGHYYW